MKKPTIFRTLIFVLAMLFNFASYSQNMIAYNSKFNTNLNENLFLQANNELSNPFSVTTNEEKVSENLAVPIIPNPVIKYAQAPYAGVVSICPNDGKELPKLFLCGSNDSRLIETNITNSTSIVWQKRTGGCTAMANANCANESLTCTWTTVGNGQDYNADTAGEFRVRISYFDGTVYVFYFNVYKNDLDPTGIIKSDITKSGSCTVPGNIIAGGFGAGYEYSFTTAATPGTWQDSNTFSVTTAGTYNVFIRLKNVSGSCIFNVKNIVVSSLTFASTATPTQPKCSTNKGSIKITTNDANRQYTYTVTKDGAAFGVFGPMALSEYTLNNLDPGVYSIVTSIDQTCITDTKSATINVVTPVTATLGITTGTGCAPGNIQVTAAGGTAPYQYYFSINGAPYASNGTNSVIAVNTAGTYDIKVEDANLCTVQQQTIVAATSKPEYTVATTNQDCNGGKPKISITVIDAHGYSLEYSINNGSFQAGSPGIVFNNLAPGTYTIAVQYGTKRSNGNWRGTPCEDTVGTYTLLGSDYGLTASGGVSALAGCGPTGKEYQGQVRITNPQGGIGPYEYSFDGKVTWVTTKEAYVDPGTYTLYIRDALGCEFAMPGITLNPKPADPTIDLTDTAYNCNGTATRTATVTNNGGTDYVYQYTIDGAINTNVPANVFTNIQVGTHEIGVDYKLVSVPTYSNLLKEDFGIGDPTKTSGIAAAYCFNDLRVYAPYLCTFPDGTPSRSVEDNAYSVTYDFWRSDDPNGNNTGAWFHFKDHTTNPNNTAGVGEAKGRYLLVNIGSAAGPYGVLYSKPIQDVIPNQPVIVDVYVANLLNKGTDGAAPIVRFELEDAAGNVVATADTGKIAEDKNDPNRRKWVPISLSLDPGNNTNLKFVIRSGSLLYNGNDIVIDDIWVRQLPKSCVEGKVFKFEVLPNKAFTAKVANITPVKCSGGSDGSFQIIAENFDVNTGFEYSIDGGVKWYNSTVGTVSFPNTIFPNITAKTYDVRVRYNPTATGCNFTIPTTITSPPAFIVDATATVATCSSGATVTATAVGGVTPYTFILTNKADGTQQTFGLVNGEYVLTGVPSGVYTVSGTDKNLCSDNKDTDLVISGSTGPTATIDKTTGLCYNGNNATIKVDISGGTGPYKYQVDFNGLGYGQLSTAFTATTFNYNASAPGTYTFKIFDNNSCEATAISQKIDVKISATAAITNSLTCNPATPNATIKVDIYDGTPTYTYKVKFNTGNYGGVQAVTGSSFNYPADKAGLYTFEVRDVNNCPIETSVTVNAIVNPTVTAKPTDPKCSGQSNGQVILEGNGGSGGYEYNFNNLGWQTKSTYTGLPAGRYSYQVKDNNGCMSAAVEYVTLTDPAVVGGSIKATVIKCDPTGTVPAVVTVSGTGGTGIYTYSFNGNVAANFSGSDSVSTTAGGTFTAYVKDSNGCVAGPFTILVNPLDQISGITLTDNGYDCSTNPPGGHVNIAAIKIDVSAPIRYQIISGPAGYNSAQNSDGEFKSLTPGDYIFQAIDIKTGCFFNRSYTVKGAPDIVAGGSVVTPIKCFGDKGKIEFTVNGVKDRGYDYEIKDALGNVIQSDTKVPETTTTIAVTASLSFGTYTITATDRKTDCDAQYSVTLTQPALPLSVTATAPKVYCGKYSVTIDADALGGTINYSYAVGQGSVVPTTFGPSDKLLVNTVNGTQLNWIVYVKDANNCTASFPITIIEEKGPIISSVDFNNQCTATSSSSFLITVNATGLIPLTYSIDGTNFQTDNFFNVSPGSYTITVKDKNGCPATATAPITVYRKLTATLDIKELDCSPTTPDATITINADGGKAGYTYAVSTNGGTTYTPISTIPSNVYKTPTAGTFYFKVTDANNCTFETFTTINSKASPTLTFKETNASCNGGKGSVQLFAANGVPGYTFSDDGTTFTNISFYDNLTVGDHTFYVKDSKECTGNVIVSISEPALVNATVTVTPFSCSPTNTKVKGKVTINPPVGGSGTYTYSFNGSTVFDSNNVLILDDNGSDQSYSYSVKDSNGCIYSNSGTVSRLNPPVILSISSSPILCLPTTSQKSTVTVATSNGVGTLTYEILSGPVINTTGATDGKFTDLTPGSYSIKVTDANGCFAIGNVTVKNKAQIAVTATKLNDVDCNANANGAIKYEVSGFTTTYSYSVNGVTAATGQTAPVFTLPNLPGTITYDVEFTDDFTKCTVPTSITITKPALLKLDLVSNVNANCGKATSAVTVIGGGGTGTYQYAILDKDVAGTATPVYGAGASFNINSNNGADPDWVIFVKDANGCTAQLPVTVATDPLPSVSATVSNQCGVTGNNFKIVALGSGGVGPYTYTIDSGVAPSPADTFTVGPGTYIITVRDVNNCPATVSVTVNEPMSAGAIRTKDISCATPAEATIEVLVSGGKAPYSYRVKIGSGSYSGSPIPFPIAGNKLIYNPTSLTGTTYEFEISDSNGIVCTTLTNVITTNTPATVTASATKVDPTCNGFNDGSVEVKGTAGVSPFTYALVPTGTPIVAADFVTSNQFGTLTAGTYDYQVKDAKGCVSVLQNITLTDPDKIEAAVDPHPIECNGNKPGYIDVTITKGGVAPFTYTIYNNAFTQVLPPVTTSATSVTFGRDGISPTILTYGDYYITIVDANGCEFKSLETRIKTPPNIEANGVASSGTCAGGAKATINVLTAVYPVTYSIFGQTPTPTNSYGPTNDTSHEFTGLDHGTTYQFQVIDAGGCFTIVEVTTPNAPSSIALDAIVKRDVKCFSDSTGEIDFTVRNFGSGVDEIDYEVRDELTNVSIGVSGSFTGLIAAGKTFASATITGLKAGNYTLYLKEKDGTECNVSQKFQILQPIQGLASSVLSRKNANCYDPAQVTLRTTGGTAAYSYAYTRAPLFPTSSTPTQSSNVLKLDPTTAGSGLVWNVVVTDANGCSVAFPVTIAIDNSPAITAQVVDKCVAEDTYVVEVNGTLGTGAHSISVDDKTSFVPMPGLPYNVTGLHSGDHTIYVQDVNGCISQQTITIDTPLGLTPRGTTLPTCADNDGVVTVTPIGGSGTYSYSITPPPASVSIVGNVISGLPAGSYTVTITDTNTLCTATAPVSLLAPTPVTFNADAIAASCFGARDGSITVNLLPGNNNPVYTYAISPIPTGMVQVDNIFSNLPQGTYDITVTSGRNCPLTLPFTVTEPKELKGTATVKQFACDINNTEQIAVVTIVPDVTTGTGPYKYRFGTTSTTYNDGNTLDVRDDLPAGVKHTITYSIQDAHGCTTPDQTVDVDPFLKISGLSFVAAPITCNNPKTDVQVTAGGGSTIINYAIIAPASAVTNTTGATNGLFTALDPGTYTFEVTNATGCKYQDFLEIKPVNNITVAARTVNNVSCNETPSVPNGSVEFTVANFAAGYTYTITPPPAPADVTVVNNTGYDVIKVINLGVNSYKIDVNDTATGCSATDTAVISQPAIPLTLELVTNINANCSYGAQVTVQGKDGSGGYSYAFLDRNVSPAPATPLLTAYKTSGYKVLDANPSKNWVAFVKDANGCIAELPLPLATDPMPTINPITGVCYTGAPVDVTLTGTGVGPLQFNIGNGYTTNPNFRLNAPGTYTFYVKDANDCVVTTPYVYELEQELLLKADLTDLTCNAPASILLTASQGTQSYTGGYKVSTDNGLTFNPITLVANAYTTSTPGTYIFKVEDSQACTAVTVPVTVTPNITPTFTYEQTNVSCNGGNNGSFTIVPGLGTPPFTYSVNGGGFQSTDIPYVGQIAGTYTVIVQDAKLCPSAPQDIKITEPAPLAVVPTVTPFKCNNLNVPTDAVLTLAASGGTQSATGEYSYSFDNGFNFSSSPSKTFNTAQATINYIVVDANGCNVTGTAVIAPYTRPTDMNITATPIYCKTAGGYSTVTVNSVSGGVGPYKYEIISPLASAIVEPLGVFNNLTAGTYQIQVTDYNGTGCSYVKTIVIEEEDKITVTPQAVIDVACNGDATGSVSFNVANYINPAPAGFTAGFTYSLTPAGGTATQNGDVVTYTGLTKGVYTFTVKDNVSDCTASVSNVIVSEPAAPLTFTTTKTNINCIKKEATITVNATGGTQAYQYAAVPSGTAPTTYSSSKDLVVDTVNGTVMSWDVYVKDQKDCSPAFQTVNITVDPLPSGAAVAPYSQCPDPLNDTYTFRIINVSGVGPFKYSIGGGFQDSDTFVVKNTGSYTLTVKDANNCETQFPALIDILPALNLQVNVTTYPNCTTNNGVIKASVLGGATPANLEFSLDGNFPNNTGDFTLVAAGDHSITVTDLTTGCTDKVDFNIPPATSITGFALTHSDVNCNGASDGTITATINPTSPGVNDNPDYTYSITAGPVLKGFQKSNVFTGLPPGDYTVTVRSARGCEDLEDVRILQPNVIVVNAPVITEFGCTAGTNGTNAATITVNSVTGGSGNYVLYDFIKNNVVVQSSSSNVYTENDPLGGSYVIKVYDDKGCVGTSTATIAVRPFASLDDVTFTVVNPITCTNTETVQVNVISKGVITVPLQYTLTGVDGTVFTTQTNNSGLFSGLIIGNYMVEVFNPITKCTIKNFHYVFDPNTFSIQVNPIQNEICYGTSNGSVELTFVDNQLVPSDDAGAFNYTITGPVPTITGSSSTAGPVSVTGLIAGQYTVVARLVNKPECTVSTIFQISQPAALLDIDATATAITCKSGNSDGTITVTATGGWPGSYKYELVGPVSVAYSDQFYFENLTPGKYTVNVKDSKGCIDSQIIDLVIPAPITFTATPSAPMLSCYGATDGSITVATPTGGQGSNYSYTLNLTTSTGIITRGPQESNVFNGLGAGTYTITVTDGFSCEATSAVITIGEPTEVKPSLALEKSVTCLTSATLTLSATGGTSPYTYSEDGITYSAPFSSSVTFAVTVGAHHYFVKDNLGCVSTVSNDIKVEPIVPLAVVLDLRNSTVNCTGEATAIIAATATGGLGNYQYSLLNNLGVEIRPAQPNGIFENLAAGTYTVHVKSFDCEQNSVAIVVTQPANPLVSSYVVEPVKCFGENNGKITISASGGTGVIKYAITPNLDQFVDSGTFDRLTAGTYKVIVQDILGCNNVYDIVVNEPTMLIASEVPNSMIPEVCQGDKDGAFSIQIKGGTAPYFASLDVDKGPFISVAGLIKDYTGLVGGKHTVYIKDSNGCISLVEVKMPLPVILNPTAEVTYDCVNNTQANMVTVTVDASNTNLADVDYALDGTGTYQPGNIFTNLAPGNHYITARHTNGCEVPTVSFVIKAYDPLGIKLSDGQPEMNVISVTGTGGAPAYEYSFNGEPFTSSNTYKIYKSGDYEVIVRDQNGCTATMIVPMVYIDVCLDNYFTPNGDGVYDTWGPGCTNIYNNLEFSIFDRYGRVIAKYHYGQKWDGRYDGAELPSGDYWYVLKLNDEKDAREFVGHFTLYR